MSAKTLAEIYREARTLWPPTVEEAGEWVTVRRRATPIIHGIVEFDERHLCQYTFAYYADMVVNN